MPRASDGTPAFSSLRLHAQEDGRTFFKMTNRGLALQKRKAARVLPDLARQLRERGTLILGTPKEEAAVRREHVILRQMGANCELWGRDKVVAAYQDILRMPI